MFGTVTCLLGLLLTPATDPVSDEGALSVPAQGKAKVQRGDLGTARQQAIRDARRVALEVALSRLAPKDRELQRALLRQVDAWTGAYRIVGESHDASTFSVDVEVDIDIPRLAKRLGPAESAAQRATPFKLDAVRERGCGSDTASAFGAELVDLHAVSRDRGTPLTFELECSVLGSVPHTHLSAVRVAVRTVGVDGLRVVAAVGFGATFELAEAGAVTRAAETWTTTSDPWRRSAIEVRVKPPRPAAGVRRLERAIVDAIPAVRSVTVGGVDTDGSIRLRVETNADVHVLSRRLSSLSVPGYAVAVESVDGPRAISVHLR